MEKSIDRHINVEDDCTILKSISKKYTPAFRGQDTYDVHKAQLLDCFRSIPGYINS